MRFRDVCAALSTQEIALTEPTPLLLIIYSGLIDDDEEIRLKSARCASWLLTCIEGTASTSSALTRTSLVAETGSDLSPAAARQKLVVVFGSKIQSHQGVFIEALTRMMGMSPGELTHQSFAFRFQQIQDKSTALFDEEKQNLFVDEYHEARQWAQLLGSMGNASPSLNEYLLSWVIDGLNFLELRNLQLEMETDLPETEELYGPLGAFSRPDMFLLVARLFLAANLLLSLDVSLQDNAKLVANLRAAILGFASHVGNDQRPLTGLTNDLYQLLVQDFRSMLKLGGA